MNLKFEWKGFNEWEQAESEYQKNVISETINQVERTAIKTERDAKLIVPVDTGKLRGSIQTDTKKNSSSITAEVGTDVEYAPVVEFGAVNQRAQPYLIPSFDRNAGQLERAIENILRG